MDYNLLLEELRKHRDRLEVAIASVEGLARHDGRAKPRGRPPKRLPLAEGTLRRSNAEEKAGQGSCPADPEKVAEEYYMEGMKPLGQVNLSAEMRSFAVHIKTCRECRRIFEGTKAWTDSVRAALPRLKEQ
jgi:hypothetical protein